MKLGDFFKSATHARPVNVKPFQFVAMAKGDVLPGGEPNPSKKPVFAKVTAAFVFLDGDGIEEARDATRESLNARFVDSKTKQPKPIDPADYEVELVYQVLARVLYEWRPNEQTIGDRMFESVDTARRFIALGEANRIFKAYNQYVVDEHAEMLTEDQFRDVEERVPRVAVTTSR